MRNILCNSNSEQRVSGSANGPAAQVGDRYPQVGDPDYPWFTNKNYRSLGSFNPSQILYGGPRSLDQGLRNELI